MHYVWQLDSLQQVLYVLLIPYTRYLDSRTGSGVCHQLEKLRGSAQKIFTSAFRNHLSPFAPHPPWPEKYDMHLCKVSEKQNGPSPRPAVLRVCAFHLLNLITLISIRYRGHPIREYPTTYTGTWRHARPAVSDGPHLPKPAFFLHHLFGKS